MARANISVVDITRSGGNVVMTPFDNSDQGMAILNDTELRTFLVAKNPTGADHTITLLIAQKVDNQAVVPRDILVPAGATFNIGPFPGTIYNQVDGKVYVNCDSTSVTIAGFRVVGA